MIEAHGLTLRHGDHVAVDGVSLALEPGRMTVVVGPNGAGKSTLMKLLTGEWRPHAGAVAYAGRPLPMWQPAALARRRAVLPQSAALSFPFTVHEIVRLGAVAAGVRDPDCGVDAALDAVRLRGWGGRLYGGLSGGEQQRVQFARALAQVPSPVAEGGPCALFLDEPTASLDLRHQIEMLAVARRFARGGGTVLAILHDLNLAAEFADEVVVLDAGRVVRRGPPSRALFEAVVADVYGLRGAASRLPPEGMPYVLPQARLAGSA